MGRYLDGASGSYLRAANAYSLGNTDWTNSVWLWLLSVPSGDSSLMGCASSDGTSGWDRVLGVTSAGQIAGYSYDGTAHGVGASAALPTNRYVHVAMTLGGGNLNVYQDGVLVATTACNSTNQVSNPYLFFEGFNWGSPAHLEYFRCRIADAACWQVALTDAEIMALAKHTPPPLVRGRSLMSYYQLTGGSVESALRGIAGPHPLNANGGSTTEAPDVPQHRSRRWIDLPFAYEIRPPVFGGVFMLPGSVSP